MYTKEEFKDLLGVVPEDFDLKLNEFWSYIEDKFKVLFGHIQTVYGDIACKHEEDCLNILNSIDTKNYVLVRKLVGNGARFYVIEDPLLKAESESWLKMLKNNKTLQF